MKPEFRKLNNKTIVILERKRTHQDFINIVLIKWQNGEYSTHVENVQFNPSAFVNGHYYQDILDSIKDYRKRL